MAAQTNKQRQARWRKRHLVKARAVGRESQQKIRDTAKEAKQTVIEWPTIPANQGAAFCTWAAENLVVPPGHPAAGAPFIIPDYLAAFFVDALDEKTNEAALIIARKNAKSSSVAALLACFMVGCLRRPGFRVGVASINREKSFELKEQIRALKDAAKLDDLQVWRRGAQGVTGPGGSSIDFVSADKNAGAASSWDIAVIDEIGLLQEQSRGLVNSMRSSVSAKAGKFLSLSVWGDGPFCGEIVKRRNDPGVCVHLHQAPEGCNLDDSKAWELANPGLDSIKSRAYMVSESRRVLSSVSDQPAFLAFDLNRPQSPTREQVCAPSDWAACTVQHSSDLPPRSGPCHVGIDIGGSASMCGAAAWWRETGRLEIFAAFPSRPGLVARGTADGVGNAYSEAASSGALKIFEGRVTPAGEFIRYVAAKLAGCEIEGAASDQFRRAEVEEILEAEPDEIPWLWFWRRQGSGPTGSADVRALQRAVLTGEIKTLRGLLMPMALRSTILRRDSNGNPSLHRGGSGARIDVLSATTLAIGLAASSRVGGFSISQVPF